MSRTGTIRFRLARFTGRAVTRCAALLTGGHMPPFVSASVLVIVHGRILVVLDPIRQEPVLPGGHLRWQEQPAAAATRETREETGFLVACDQLVGVYGGRERTGEDGVVRIVFRAEIVGGSLRSSREGKAAWMPVSDFTGSIARDAPIAREWLESAQSEPTTVPGELARTPLSTATEQAG